MNEDESTNETEDVEGQRFNRPGSDKMIFEEGRFGPGANASEEAIDSSDDDVEGHQFTRPGSDRFAPDKDSFIS